MFSFFSASGSIPGLTSDQQSPGGIVVAGGINAGNPGATNIPSFSFYHGSITFLDTVGNNLDIDNTINVYQQAGLTADSLAAAINVLRAASLNGHDYLKPIINIEDTTLSTAPIISFSKQSVVQVQVDGDGIRIHDKIKTGASVVHSLGAYSGKSVPIYDEAGTLLGYMPLYA